MKSVLYVNWTGEIGGAEMALLRLLQALDKNKIRPLAWQMQGGPMAKEFSSQGLPLFVKNLSRFRKVFLNIRFHFDLYRVLKQESIDLVHANGTLSYLAAYVACKLARVPLIWWLVDTPEGKAFPEKIAGILPANFVVCNSKATEQAYRRFYGNRKTAVVYPSVEVPETVELDREKKEEIFKRFGIPHGAKLILSVGRMQRWKGQDVLIRAIPEILKKHPSTLFLFCGDALPGMDDGFKNEIQDLAKELNVSHACRFMGFVKEINEIMKISDAVVHTSIKPEPFGLVIAEAMALGRPVIASEQGGPLEMIEHEKDGLLAPPADSHAFMTAILNVLEDPAFAACLGKAARQKALAFRKEYLASEMEKIYEKVSP